MVPASRKREQQRTNRWPLPQYGAESTWRRLEEFCRVAMLQRWCRGNLSRGSSDHVCLQVHAYYKCLSCSV
jgi:hypothetical protein